VLIFAALAMFAITMTDDVTLGFTCSDKQVNISLSVSTQDSKKIQAEEVNAKIGTEANSESNDDTGNNKNT